LAGLELLYIRELAVKISQMKLFQQIYAKMHGTAYSTQLRNIRNMRTAKLFTFYAG